MSDEWGPWIEHDGKGCPCVGEYIQVTLVWKDHITGEEGLVTHAGEDWDWSNYPNFWKAVRYRIRKPRALIQLIEMVENLPAPTERVDA